MSSSLMKTLRRVTTEPRFVRWSLPADWESAYIPVILAWTACEALPEFTFCDYPPIWSLTFIASCFSSLFCLILWGSSLKHIMSDFLPFLHKNPKAPRFVRRHLGCSHHTLQKSSASTDCPLQNTKKQALWGWQCVEIDFCSSLLNREVHLYVSVKQAICAPHPKSFRRLRPVQFIL